MKLLFFFDNLRFFGGGDYCIMKFAEYLAREGHQITLFGTSKLYDLEGPNIKVHYRGNIPRMMKGFGLMNDLWGAIYDLFVVRPHIFMHRKEYAYFIGYLRKSAIRSVKYSKKYGVPSVNFFFETPDWLAESLKDSWEKQNVGKLRRMWGKTRTAYKDTDILLGNSALAQQHCEQWIGKSTRGFVYPGIDLPNMKNVKERDQIIYVGRLVDTKNIDELIRAVAMIDKAPELIILGDGPLRPDLEKLAEKLAVKARFLSDISDEVKFREIAQSKMLIFPSSFEGFGMPPMEALALAVPAVCYNIPILKDIYKDNLEYVKHHNVKALVKKIDFLLKNPLYRTKRGKSGQQYVRKNFGWKTSVQQIEGILREPRKQRVKTVVQNMLGSTITNIQLVRAGRTKELYIAVDNHGLKHAVKFISKPSVRDKQGLETEYYVLRSMNESDAFGTPLLSLTDDYGLLVRNHIEGDHLVVINDMNIKAIVEFLQSLYLLKMERGKLRRKRVRSAFGYLIKSTYRFLHYKTSKLGRFKDDTRFFIQYIRLIISSSETVRSDGNHIIHGDLNPCNIILSNHKAVAIDWAQSYLGNFSLNVASLISEMSNPVLMDKALEKSDRQRIISELIAAVEDSEFVDKVNMNLMINYFMKWTGVHTCDLKSDELQKTRHTYYTLWSEQIAELK